MNIICMGDSITYGYGLADLSSRFSDLTAARTGHTVINRGVSGDTTGGMLARCQTQVFAQKPDLMVFLGGINDISITGQYRPVCANVVAVCRQAEAIGLPIILGLPLPVVPEDMCLPVWDPEQDARLTKELGERYARWMRGYAADKGYPLADFRTPFLLPDGSVNRALFQDGLHPTREGHRLMAEVLCRVLEEHFS